MRFEKGVFALEKDGVPLKQGVFDPKRACLCKRRAWLR